MTAESTEAPVSPTSRRANPRFLALWGAVGTANLADGVFQVALPVVLLGRGAPAWSVPLVLGASRLPWVMLTLHAGLLADRCDRRTLLMASYIMRGLAVLLVAISAAFGWPLVAIAVIAAFLVGCAETVGDTTAHSVTPAVVHKDDLMRANGRLQSTELSMNLLVGPAFAGLIATTSQTAGLVAAGLLYVAASGCAVALPSTRPRTTGGAPPRLTDGLRYLFAAPKLRWLALSVALLNLAYAQFQSGLPLKVLGSPRGGFDLGLYWALSGLVCLVLGVFVEGLIAKLGQLRVLLGGTAGLGVGFIIVGFTDDRWLLGFGTALTGCLVLINVVTVSYRQSVVPDHLLGRVTAAYRLLAFGALPLGSLVAAGVLAAWNVDAVILMAALPVCASAVLFTLAYRSAEQR